MAKCLKIFAQILKKKLSSREQDIYTCMNGLSLKDSIQWIGLKQSKTMSKSK